jgi:hypothetical protein
MPCKRRKRGTKKKRKPKRRRKTELQKTSDFVLDTGKLMVQTGAVMAVAKTASDVMKK